MVPTSKLIGPERRDHQRSRAYKSVKVIYNKNLCVFDAVLRDITAYGGQLEMRLSEFLPERFDIWLAEENVRVPCNVKWRRHDRIGIEFNFG